MEDLSDIQKSPIEASPLVFEEPCPDEPVVYYLNAQRKVILYRLHTAEDEQQRKHTIQRYFNWAILGTFFGWLRLRKASQNVIDVRLVARTWERRCMNLMGRKDSPARNVPSAVEDLLYGKRGKYWVEELHSPWRKMPQEREPLTRRIHPIAKMVRKLEEIWEPSHRRVALEQYTRKHTKPASDARRSS